MLLLYSVCPLIFDPRGARRSPPWRNRPTQSAPAPPGVDDIGIVARARENRGWRHGHVDEGHFKTSTRKLIAQHEILTAEGTSPVPPKFWRNPFRPSSISKKPVKSPVASDRSPSLLRGAQNDSAIVRKHLRNSQRSSSSGGVPSRCRPSSPRVLKKGWLRNR